MTPEQELDAWEAVLAPALAEAMSEWAQAVTPMVLPSLTADGDPPPDLGAGHGGDNTWRDAFNRTVLPLLAGLIGGQTFRVLRARGITPPEPTDAASRMGRAVPYPNEWLAGLTPTERDGLVSEFASLKQHLGNLLPDGARVIIESPSWQDHISDHFSSVSNRVVNMPDEVFRQITTRLDHATREGTDPAVMRDMVQEVLSETGHDQIVANRASLIARTEATTGYNMAAHEAALIERDETGEEMEHVWVATIDSRTRDSHFAADGQRVPLDEPFEVNGYRLKYPGDPDAPVWEIANCRCTKVNLAVGEPMPGEAGRQTEPGGESRHRDGSQADEIARREADGVTRAYEDPAGIGISASIDKETHMRRTFSGVLAPIGAPTGDGRKIATDAEINFRDFPLPLMWQRSTSDGHDQSVIVGRIDTATVDEGEIIAEGVMFDSPDAIEATELLAEEVVRPSVDMCDMVAEEMLLDADGMEVAVGEDGMPDGDPVSEMMLVREATIMAATLVAKPAFAEAKLSLGDEVADTGRDEPALVASAPALLDTFDSAAFTDPRLDGPTALTVTDDGHVYGHLATWGTCHVGMGDRCITPPTSRSGYSHFHVSTVPTGDGPVSVGRLTVGGGHAGPREAANAAASHYDNTGTCWALVKAGEDAHGIWVAGVINPDASEAAVRAGASAPLSGDWRSIGGRLELVAALSVNTPGFPVARTYANDRGTEMSLVAAGVTPTARPLHEDEFIKAVVSSAVEAYIDREKRVTEATEIRERHAAREAARIMNRRRPGGE